MQWDIFCRVIDNYGDIGVCWRVSADLASRGHSVRLWVDDASALAWMAPGALQGAVENIQILPWSSASSAQIVSSLPLADVWIEAFSCDIAPEFIATSAITSGARGQYSPNFPVWINLEYLTAESFAGRAHGLPSPVMSGPGRGATKYFFYPGFKPGTGGLPRETTLIPALNAISPADRLAWLGNLGVDWHGERLVSLFCYEPAALPRLISTLAGQTTPVQLLVTSGRASVAVRALLSAGEDSNHDDAASPSVQRGSLKITFLPLLSQQDYDRLMWSCDLNFVRGEDSLVRALWAGKPFVWQIYPQDDGAHFAKLEAFLDAIGAGPTLRAFHRVWNGTSDPTDTSIAPEPFSLHHLQEWCDAVQRARSTLLNQQDLVTQLIDFVKKKR